MSEARMDWKVVTQHLLAEAHRLDGLKKALPDRASESLHLYYATQVSLLTILGGALAKGALADAEAKTLKQRVADRRGDF